jgi:hypothetical protein
MASLKSEVRFKLVSIGAELAACETLLRAAENSPQYKTAEQEFAPLLAAAAERDAAEEKVRIDRQRKELELTQARESAWRAALERAEESPIIKKATRELDAAKAAEAELYYAVVKGFATASSMNVVKKALPLDSRKEGTAAPRRHHFNFLGAARNFSNNSFTISRLNGLPFAASFFSVAAID